MRTAWTGSRSSGAWAIVAPDVRDDRVAAREWSVADLLSRRRRRHARRSSARRLGLRRVSATADRRACRDPGPYGLRTVDTDQRIAAALSRSGRDRDGTISRRARPRT